MPWAFLARGQPQHMWPEPACPSWRVPPAVLAWPSLSICWAEVPTILRQRAWIHGWAPWPHKSFPGPSLMALCSQKSSPKPKTFQMICCLWPLLFLSSWVPANSKIQVWSLLYSWTRAARPMFQGCEQRPTLSQWGGPKGLVCGKPPHCHDCANTCLWYCHGIGRDPCHGPPINLQALQHWRPMSSYKQAPLESSLVWRCIQSPRGHQVGMTCQQAVSLCHPNLPRPTCISDGCPPASQITPTQPYVRIWLSLGHINENLDANLNIAHNNYHYW